MSCFSRPAPRLTRLSGAPLQEMTRCGKGARGGGAGRNDSAGPTLERGQQRRQERLAMKFIALTIAASALLAGAAQAAPRSDRQFLTEAMRGDNGEVTLGRMAQDRGASPAVRA